MKRYGIDPTCLGCVAETLSGGYVTYKEAAAIIAEKDKEIVELKIKANHWEETCHSQWENHQQTMGKVKERLHMAEVEKNIILVEKGIVITELQERLRASNEALVAAEARIMQLEDYSLKVADALISVFPEAVGMVKEMVYRINQYGGEK